MTCEAGPSMSFYIRWGTSAIGNYVGFWTSIYTIIFQTIVQNNQKIGIWYIYIYFFLKNPMLLCTRAFLSVDGIRLKALMLGNGDRPCWTMLISNIFLRMCVYNSMISATCQWNISMCFYVPFPYPKKCGQHFPGEGDTQTLSTRYFSRVLWLAPSSEAWIF